MPERLFNSNSLVYTIHEVEDLMTTVATHSTLATKSKSKIDAWSINWRGSILKTEDVEEKNYFRDALYDRVDFYTTIMPCTVDVIVGRIMAATSTWTDVVQKEIEFARDGTTKKVWDIKKSLLCKPSFYTTGGNTGKMKLEIGTEAEFASASTETWISDQIILSATLLTEYNNETLTLDVNNLRIVFVAYI